MKIINIDGDTDTDEKIDNIKDIEATKNIKNIKDIEEIDEYDEPDEYDSKDTKRKRRKDTKSLLREILSLFLSLVLVVVLTFIIIKYVGQRTQVSGSSMEYTLADKDNLIVDKITYRFTEPQRFDIIVFPQEGLAPKETANQTYYIKRIIGMPGETIQISGGSIYINGEILAESYGKEVIKDPKMAAEPIEIGENEYFVLGDNRNHSADSREIGLIKRSKIIGRAWMRIWPLESFGILKHQ